MGKIMEAIFCVVMSDSKGDNIFSLNDIVNKYIENAQKMISKIEADLNGINRSKFDLARQEGLKSNSGAEKIIVYLSIIHSIMNYSKSESAGIRNNSAYSVLILDNPFGCTTAAHILTPMFNLAEFLSMSVLVL